MKMSEAKAFCDYWSDKRWHAVVAAYVKYLRQPQKPIPDLAISDACWAASDFNRRLNNYWKGRLEK